jgi:hypothetical protein
MSDFSTASETLDPLFCRRALEALRAGVPNRDVVRLLPPLHQRARTEFESLLRETESSWENQKAVRGLLLSGGFGMGKSHLLDYLNHAALENGFVCSRVTLSKETPLSDMAKLYRAAVASAVAPDRTGPALSEIADTLQTDRAPHYEQLWQWAHRETELDPRLPATLLLFEREASADEDLREKILAEWTGYPMKIGDLRNALKAVGEPANAYLIGRPRPNQEMRRFEFLTRFFRAAGYNGWIILLDEVELTARYGIRQRGRAYAHLSYLLGQEKAHRIPGLAVAAAITDDYAGEVLRRKGDRMKVPARMIMVEDPLREAAERGMEAIESGTAPLIAPTKKQVSATYERVREIYGTAYNWSPPNIEGAIEYAGSTRMRQYVRAWVNLWDLRRLYDYEGQLVAEEVRVSYEEDADLETASPDENPFEE